MASKEQDVAIPIFNLTTNSTFSTRSNDIFGSLEALEQKHAAYQKTQASNESLESTGVIKSDPVEEEDDKGEKRDITNTANTTTKHRHHDPYRRERSHWKRPENQRSWRAQHEKNHRNFPEDFRRPKAPPRLRKAPDFKTHPQNWTCYSLEDVADNDLSEKTNTRAAFDFLFERKKERERMERLAAGLSEEEEKFESDTAACSKGLISFSRRNPKADKKKQDNVDDYKSSYNDEKLCELFPEDDDVCVGKNVGDEQMESHVNEQPVGLLGEGDKFSDRSTSLPSKDDGDEKIGSVAAMFKFKSRKNMRKQIRKNRDDDEENDNDAS